MARDDFDKWVDQWDKAQEDGIFNSPKPHIPTSEVNPSDFFGIYRPEQETSVNDVDAEYWDRVYKLSNHSGDVPDATEDMLNEQTPVHTASEIQDEPLRELPGKDGLGVKGAELANTANPIHPWTRGKDQRPKVTPEWIAGNMLSELVSMKFNLYQLEVKLNADPNFGAYTGDTDKMERVQEQIDDLKGRIDKLSNSLSPDFMQQELS